MITAIVACDKRGLMGYGGEGLPWGSLLKDDLAHFKQVTTGKTVIMGRKTFTDDIARCFPYGLPNRRNIIVSRDSGLIVPGCQVMNAEQALASARAVPEAFVIGGQETLDLFQPHIDRYLVTEIEHRFPFTGKHAILFCHRLDAPEWTQKTVLERPSGPRNAYPFRIVQFDRTSPERLFVHMAHARGEEQAGVMQGILAAGECPFCADNLAKYHKGETLFNGDYWLLTRNQWPYLHTKDHFLLIYKVHVERFSQVSPFAGPELIMILAEIERRYGVDTGAVFARFGDPSYTGATVRHLHAQVIRPDHTNPDFEPIRVKLGTSPEAEAAKVRTKP